jgi:hypothetical protein
VTVTDSGRRPTVFPDEEARNADSERLAAKETGAAG